MNSRNLVLKSLASLYRRQLLDIHLDTVSAYWDMFLGLGSNFGRPRQPFLLKDRQHRATIGLGEVLLQFVCNSDWTMVWIDLSISHHSLPICRCYYSPPLQRGATAVQGRLPVDPSLDRRGVDPESLGQLANTDSFFQVQSSHLLTLFDRQCCLGVKFHSSPPSSQAIYVF